MKPVRKTAFIRRRGQLTIPDAVRKAAAWAQESSVIFVIMEDPETIVLRPYHPLRKTDWKKLRRLMKKVQSFKGEGSQKESLSEFIARDRLQRR